MREVNIKVIDLIDMALVLLQSKCDLPSLYFFLDLFPDELTEKDFNDYFNHYRLVDEAQRPAMEDLARTLRIMHRNHNRGELL